MDHLSRRQFISLSISASFVSLAGCTQGDSVGEGGTETESADGTEAGCWPSMCQGTLIIEVRVSSEFSGSALLETSCRDEAATVLPGDSFQVVREEDGEECGVTLSIDDERVFDERVEGHASVTVTVGSSGEVDVERVML